MSDHNPDWLIEKTNESLRKHTKENVDSFRCKKFEENINKSIEMTNDAISPLVEKLCVDIARNGCGVMMVDDEGVHHVDHSDVFKGAAKNEDKAK